MNFKIVKRDMGSEYYGMNYWANKELNAGFNISPNEIFVDENLTGSMLKRTIAHEKVEANLMKNKGMKYNLADSIAIKFEKFLR